MGAKRANLACERESGSDHSTSDDPSTDPAILDAIRSRRVQLSKVRVGASRAWVGDDDMESLQDC